MQRRAAILQAAGHQFSHHGFRGASLREIAREAGVSLTLLSHHFGTKTQLLAAVIETHRALLDERASVIDRLAAGGAGTFCTRDLVEAWVRLAFDTAAEPDGEQYLRLLARLIDDPGEDGVQVAREHLDEAALLFVDALQQCHPRASRHAAASAYVFVSATILKFAISGRRMFRLAGPETAMESDDQDRRRLTRFLVAGIEAALDEPDGTAQATQDAVGAPQPASFEPA